MLGCVIHWGDASFASLPRIWPLSDTIGSSCAGLEDTLEQGRIWVYRYYRPDVMAYGFGCGSTGAGVRDLSHYYTLSYTPTSGDWNGRYNATTVEVADKGLHLAYRKGYYGTPENAQAHYDTAQGPAAVPVPADSSGARSSGPTISATPVAAEPAGAASLDTSAAEAAPNPARRVLHRRQEEIVAAKAAPNPASSVFTVQVIPASATVVPASANRAADKEKQEYRTLTLRFSMPASELKVVQSRCRPVRCAQLEIDATGYADGKSLDTYGGQVAVNFNGPADPRTETFTITAKMTLNILEHGRNRWLLVTARDLATGQFGSLSIPMGQVKMPALHSKGFPRTSVPQ